MTSLLIAALIGMEGRDAAALREKEPILRRLAQRAGLKHPVPRIYFRAHKAEMELEIWGGTSLAKPLKLLAAYPIAGMSGSLGPKRREGDLQAPEGFYFIDRFNPRSSFHLSLGINYPNASDRILSDRQKPGGDIFIHGSDVSIGCLAMTDEMIKEIYSLAWLARQKGQRRIPVHIFPFRMTNAQWTRHVKERPHLRSFWQSLRPAWLKFEASKVVPKTAVDTRTGSYTLLR
jgi:murein L,D-transpeptidase YafK